MAVVVAHQEIQGLLLALHHPDMPQTNRIQVAHEVQDEGVVGLEQPEEVSPGQTFGLFHGNPGLGLVAGKFQPRDLLQTGEALMVVAGRIDEVAGDLLHAPVVRSWLHAHDGLGR